MPPRDLYEIRNALLEKPPAERTAAEQHMVNSICLLIDIESGGWLYNISPAAGEGRVWIRLRQAAESAVEIGATRLGGLLQEVISLVESVDVQQPPGIWDDFIRCADPEKRMKALEYAIDSEVPAARDHLKVYIARHFGD